MNIECTWYDHERDINVVYCGLPREVDEVVTPNADGSYTVFLRATASHEQQTRAYEHAIWHIEHGDLEDGVDVQEAERSAHARI